MEFEPGKFIKIKSCKYNSNLIIKPLDGRFIVQDYISKDLYANVGTIEDAYHYIAWKNMSMEAQKLTLSNLSHT